MGGRVTGAKAARAANAGAAFASMIFVCWAFTGLAAAQVAGPPAASGAGAGVSDVVLTEPAPMTLETARLQAKVVLEQHCAACHQSGRQTGGLPVTGGFDNILALYDLVREPTLVAPGRPDASRLYQVMLARHRPLDALKGSLGPTAEEIEAIRDWIEREPPPPAACAERQALSESDASQLIQAWQTDPSAAGDTRFVTLAHLANACISDSDLARYRDEVAGIIADMAGRSAPAPGGVQALGDQRAVLAVRLAQSEIDKEAWDRMEAAAPPHLIAGAVPADWLAFHAAPTRAPTLARLYRDDVDLHRAAAEAGTKPDAFAAQLGTVEGPARKIALQLRQGLVSRADWERLIRSLKGLPPAGAEALPDDGRLRIALWSDKTVYKSGELASFTALASGSCYLTLIGIDTSGNATVLFPNDFEQDNRVRAGSSITVPLKTAGYQLRVKEPGTESVVAICSTARRRPQGILPEYERQRFTILGNWRVFLATADRIEPEAVSRRRAARDAPTSTLDQEARAAITYKVE